MKRILLLTTVLSILALVTVPKAYAQTKIVKPESVGISADSLTAATKRLHRHVDEGKLPGTFTRVIKDGKLIYEDMYGQIDMENDKPTQENSLYRIFSMTKPITAVAIMTLYDQGKLSLDDKVSTYIPEFAQTQVYKEVNGKHSTEAQKEEMTIRHLLTHTSGIPYGWERSYTDSIYNVKQYMAQEWTIAEMTKDLATVPLKYQPGTTYNYGLGIDVAGYIVEVVSGMALDTYFKTVIFDPLKMDDTDFFVPEDKVDRIAGLYTHNEAGELILADKRLTISRNEAPTLLLGGAGLVSTLGDYEIFCRMLLNKGKWKGKRVLSKEAAELMMSNHFGPDVPTYPNMGHGLSGTVQLDNGEYSWGGAASTKFWINPTHNLIIVMYTQLIGSKTNYATEFKATIDGALLNKEN
ncbi:MAG: serine hydrolase domain-containing protein [Bacteroidota bacterium]